MEGGCRVCYRGIATKGDTMSFLGHWRVEGEKGILKVENDVVYLNDEEVHVAWEARRSLSDLNQPALNRVVLHQFIEYLKENKEPRISGRNNLNSLHMVFGSIEAAEKGKKIPLWTR